MSDPAATASPGLPDIDMSDFFRPWQSGNTGTRIATIGCSFSQAVFDQIGEQGLVAVETESAPPGLPSAQRAAFGYGLNSARFGDIRTPKQLRQLVAMAHKRFSPTELSWELKGRYYDPFRPQIEPAGFSSPGELEASRERHLKAVRVLLRQADLLVVTLTCTRSWISKQDGAAMPLRQEALGDRKAAGQYEFAPQSYSQVYDDLKWTIQFINGRVNPKLGIVLVVAADEPGRQSDDVLSIVESMRAKAILTAAASQLQADFSNVDHFPCHELLAAPALHGRFHGADGQGTTRQGLRWLTDQFFKGLRTANEPWSGSGDEELETRASGNAPYPLTTSAEEKEEEAALFKALPQDFKKLTVGVLGSCRVYTPLGFADDYGRVKRRHNGVFGYVHNPAEVLQVVDVLRGVVKVPPELAALMSVNQADPLREGIDLFQRNFGAADLIVVELSSLRIVRYRGLQLQIHHVRNLLIDNGLATPACSMETVFASRQERVARLRGESGGPSSGSTALAIDLLLHAEFFELSAEQIDELLQKIDATIAKPILFVGPFVVDFDGNPIAQRQLLRERMQHYTNSALHLRFVDPTPFVAQHGYRESLRDLGHYNKCFEPLVGAMLAAEIDAFAKQLATDRR
ncbi:GSCFA domain-containing protein [Hydrocarboniphaga sp.]|uniref:GSCFA domain-containing protein n=1 Tax=Hydrocarboniphaga sp. TaxID=2033016 RepID=UPI003D0EDD8E